ncbi:MAG: hypothetical protein J6333_10125, partial [Planctomycetes bacterium]|nr:hypothetical protein [Planctomycetota bacterium]
EDKADKKKMTVAEFANKRPAPQAALSLSANDLASMPLDQLKPHIAALLPAKATDVQINPVINRLTVDGIVLDQENRDILLLRLAPAAARLTVSLRIDPNALVAALRAELRHEDLEPQMLHPFLIGPQHRLFIGMPAKASDDEITKAAIVASQYMASPELTSVSRLPETKDGK